MTRGAPAVASRAPIRATVSPCSLQRRRQAIGALSRRDEDHADAAVEDADHLARRHGRGAGAARQPSEDGRNGPASGVEPGGEAPGEDARDVLHQPAAGDVAQTLHPAGGERGEAAPRVDPRRLQQSRAEGRSGRERRVVVQRQAGGRRARGAPARSRWRAGRWRQGPAARRLRPWRPRPAGSRAPWRRRKNPPGRSRPRRRDRAVPPIRRRSGRSRPAGSLRRPRRRSPRPWRRPWRRSPDSRERTAARRLARPRRSRTWPRSRCRRCRGCRFRWRA